MRSGTFSLQPKKGKPSQTFVLSRLALTRDSNTGLLLGGGRFQFFGDDKTAVPILPHSSWISTLLAREAHKVNHEESAGTLLRMRKKVWVTKPEDRAEDRQRLCDVLEGQSKEVSADHGRPPVRAADPSQPIRGHDG